MRSWFSSFSVLIAVLFVLSACSKNNLAQKTEVDDMYFTSKDRASLEASEKVYIENFSDDYEKPLSRMR